jgi:hypothetical protein
MSYGIVDILDSRSISPLVSNGIKTTEFVISTEFLESPESAVSLSFPSRFI